MVSVDRNIDKNIGSRLRSYREAKDMSQSELGNALGVTFQQVQKYESGKNRVSGSSIHLLCRALGVTPNELLGYTNGSRKHQDVFEIINENDLVQVILALNALSPAKRHHAVKLMMNLIRWVAA